MNLFQKHSMAGTGAAIVVVLNALLPLFGIQVPEGSVQSVFESILNVAGFVLLVWGQMRREDLEAGIWRK